MRGIGSEPGGSKALAPRGWREANLPWRSFSLDSTWAPDVMARELQERIDGRSFGSTLGLAINVTVAPTDGGSRVLIEIRPTAAAVVISTSCAIVAIGFVALLVAKGQWVAVGIVSAWFIFPVVFVGDWIRAGDRIERGLRDLVADVPGQLEQVGPYRS